MSFNAIYNSLNASERRNLLSVQVSKEKTVKTQGVAVIKVLSVNAVPVIEKYTLEENNIVVNGAITYSILYEKADNIQETIVDSEDFSVSIDFNETKQIESVCLNANLVDVNVKNFNDDTINISSLIEVNGYAVIKEETKFLSGVEDAYYQQEEVSFTKLKATVNQNYTVSNQIDVSQKPLRLLNLTANGIINNIITAKGYITVSGVVQYNICYEYEENEELQTKDISNTFNFKYEIDCPNCEATDYAVVCLNNVKDGITCEIENGENNATLNLEVKFNLCGEVYSVLTENIICDVFSLTNKLQLSYKSFSFTKYLGAKSFREKVYGVCEISEENPRIDKILCVLDSNAVLTKTYVDGYNLNVEGIAYTNVIYLNAEETIESKMQIEIPFSISTPTEKEFENSEVDVKNLVTDVMARIRRGREIEIDVSLEMFANFFSTKSNAVISNIELLEEKQNNLSAFSIYIAKDNDSVWSIAKKMCIAPNDLMEQNPKLSEGNKKGDKVIVYRKK